jgi:hypothetical protein
LYVTPVQVLGWKTDRRRHSVTNSDGITDHIRAREEEHFRKKDRELIEKLRRADAEARARRALSRGPVFTIPQCSRN